MTDKEAIKQLESVTIYHEGKFTREALDIAIKALKRQNADGCVVKRVPVHEGCYLCPNCGNQVSNIKDKFCNQCGTKLIFDYGEPEWNEIPQ